MNKIKNFKLNLTKIKNWKKKRKKIVVTNGCFDLLHPGHKYLLKKSKRRNEKLVVLINSDKSTRSIKGNKRPIDNQFLRKKKIDKIKDVDISIIFNQKTPLNMIKKIKPNIIVKGEDYKNKRVSGLNFIKKFNGRLRLIKIYKNYSTSKIIKKRKLYVK